MNIDPNDKPQLESAVLDGGDLTEAEQLLVDQGVDFKDDDTADPAAAAAAAGADDEAAAATAKAEEERVAAEKAEADRLAQEEVNAANERAAAEAKQNADIIAAAAAAAVKPEPPKDFEAAFKELDQKRDDEDLGESEYRRALTDLVREEANYNASVQVWEIAQAQRNENAEAARVRAENAWNTAALKWENENTDFMANPLRQQHMQQAINFVISQNRTEGKIESPDMVLQRAAEIAYDYTGYTKPAPNPDKDPKTEIGKAVGDRRPTDVPATLGDVPNAGNDPIKGNEAFANLDHLSIEELEETVQNMTGSQLEKYLRDAPGAKSNGRGNDPKETGQDE